MIYGYCRSSTPTVDKQKKAIGDYVARRFGPEVKVDRWATDDADGEGYGLESLSERPKGKKLVAALKPGDLVVTDTTDRISRCVTTFGQSVKEIHAKGASLAVASLPVCPSTADGAMAQMLAIAQYLQEGGDV